MALIPDTLKNASQKKYFDFFPEYELTDLAEKGTIVSMEIPFVTCTCPFPLDCRNLRSQNKSFRHFI